MIERWSVVCTKGCVLLLLGALTAPLHGIAANGEVFESVERNIRISGVVRDSEGNPLVGATLIVEGTTQGTSTGANGEYSLTVPSKARIICSYLGFNSVTQEVGTRTRLDFTLEASANSIEGCRRDGPRYHPQGEEPRGTPCRKSASDDITNSASGNWLSGMAGKVAGLNLDQSSAGPGGSVRVTLRGEGSLSYNNNTALFVVDGVPIGNVHGGKPPPSGSYESDDAPIDYGNGAGDINPEDVESISILKGPAATAPLWFAGRQRCRDYHDEVRPSAAGHRP